MRTGAVVAEALRFFDGRGDDLGVLAAEEGVLAGLPVVGLIAERLKDWKSITG